MNTEPGISPVAPEAPRGPHKPQAPQEAQRPTVVHVARPLEPEKVPITPEQRRRHDESLALYPGLNLSEGEYVIRAVRRHPIGLVLPLGFGTIIIASALSLLVNYDVLLEIMPGLDVLGGFNALLLPILAFILAIAVGMFTSYYVYVKNRFFLTNESVIQEIQHSIFSHHEQTVSLGNIEDASYTRRGILQHILDYGDIRLSTEGEETTYRFSFVAAPKEHIARLNNAVEAFKNGRPVTGD